MSIEEIKEQYPNSWKDIIQAADLNTAKAVIDLKKRLRKAKRLWEQAQIIADSIEDKKERRAFIRSTSPSKEDQELIKLLAI